MIGKLDSALEMLESKERTLKTTLEQTKSEPGKAKEQLIQIDELMHSIKSLQKVPNEAKLKLIQDVLGRLDDDFDGQLKIDDVLKVSLLLVVSTVPEGRNVMSLVNNIPLPNAKTISQIRLVGPEISVFKQNNSSFVILVEYYVHTTGRMLSVKVETFSQYDNAVHN